MKSIILALSILSFSSQVFAMALLEEAICTGTLDGGQINVRAHVNPNKWCVSSDQTEGESVLTMQEDEELSVFTTKSTEQEVNGRTMVVHIGQEIDAVIALTYYIEGVPSTGRGILQLKDGNENQQVILDCSFPEYILDCGGH